MKENAIKNQTKKVAHSIILNFVQIIKT